MIGRLALIVLQVVVGWWGTPMLQRTLSFGGDLQVFANGAAAAVIVSGVGLVATQILKDIGRPTPRTLVLALAGGLAGAAIIVFRLPQMLGSPLPAPPLAIMLGLAILGYHLRR